MLLSIECFPRLFNRWQNIFFRVTLAADISFQILYWCYLFYCFSIDMLRDIYCLLWEGYQRNEQKVTSGFFCECREEILVDRNRLILYWVSGYSGIIGNECSGHGSSTRYICLALELLKSFLCNQIIKGVNNKDKKYWQNVPRNERS